MLENAVGLSQTKLTIKTSEIKIRKITGKTNENIHRISEQLMEKNCNKR